MINALTLMASSLLKSRQGCGQVHRIARTAAPITAPDEKAAKFSPIFVDSEIVNRIHSMAISTPYMNGSQAKKYRFKD
ncbi:hypothetical protein BJN45_13190 [Azonexus hydrophilus]|uniref:Uncharacterized protein n=1 Tax=Azonexus hydrophilus TaxID=418702 RepID=A0A1R1I3A1_9RHOO|nr:hypothetical protein [Azonexus hydrophilus]OMG53173.1 hypothetical protein BJN45_13190 [Azonexus hydrophilus]